MSIDRSLKVKGALTRHRNVLNRAERIEKLKDEERWEDDQSVFGLPKISHRKARVVKKESKAEAAQAESEAAGTETTATDTETQ